jgi:hypothetical protein
VSSVEVVFLNLERTSCSQCGIAFAAPLSWVNERRADGKTFYCPNGHHLVFRESTETKLKRQLESKESTERRLRDELAAAERKASRFKCTACSRDFASAPKLLAHTRKAHNAPLRLPKDAGPTATNTDVRSV